MAKQNKIIKAVAKIATFDVKRRPISTNVNCGQCIFHKRFATYDHPCRDMGVVASAIPCNRFSADPNAVAIAPEIFSIAVALGKVTSVSALQAFAAMALTSRRVNRLGFATGQWVVIRVGGDDFLRNYCYGVVTGATTKQLILAGKDGFVAMLNPASVLTVEQWERKKKKLIALNRIDDPKGVKRIKIKGNDSLTMHHIEMLSAPKRRGRPVKKMTGQELAAKKKKTTFTL